MPHSLRCRLGNLRHKGLISDSDYDRLCKALDNENVLDKIRAEIDDHRKTIKDMADIDDWYAGKLRGHDCDIEIIDKYKTKPKDIEAQATDFLAEARACAEREDEDHDAR